MLEDEISSDLTEFTYFRGRVALAAILRAMGIRRGEQVAIQAFTCVAVPEAILSVGAEPVYVDVDRGGINMDPTSLASRLTPATKVVVVQHTFGFPAPIQQIQEVAARSGTAVVEDCAHTICTTSAGKRVGRFGAASFYSFEASKPLFAGIGGSAITTDPVIAAELRHHYTHLSPPRLSVQAAILAMYAAYRIAYRPITYWKVRRLYRALVRTGIIKGNYNKIKQDRPADDFDRKMGEWQRLLLRRGLRQLEKQTAHRLWVAEQYRSMITHPQIEHISASEDTTPVLARYPLVTDRKTDLLRQATEAKVELADFYATPIHPLDAGDLPSVGYQPGCCPEAETMTQRIVSLPINLHVGAKQLRHAARFINSFR